MVYNQELEHEARTVLDKSCAVLQKIAVTVYEIFTS
jgi:hypothetical protein